MFIGSVLQVVPRWTAIIGIFLFCTTFNLIQADPTDDLSLTLSHAPEHELYRLMPTHRVAHILSDHLDEFPEHKIQHLANHLIRLCKLYRFDPAFILSLIEVESAFRVKVVSSAGAVGLMQVMPATALTVVREVDLGHESRILLGAKKRKGEEGVEEALGDPFVNLSVGIAYLSMLRKHYSGRSPYLVVAAYNVGPAKLDSLLSRKNFKPVKTKKYYEDIRRRLPEFRYYQRATAPVMKRSFAS